VHVSDSVSFGSYKEQLASDPTTPVLMLSKQVSEKLSRPTSPIKEEEQAASEKIL
jgi:hypothetical protein